MSKYTPLEHYYGCKRLRDNQEQATQISRPRPPPWQWCRCGRDGMRMEVFCDVGGGPPSLSALHEKETERKRDVGDSVPAPSATAPAGVTLV
eukprot:206741-Prorocentrum_minimum.AAC.2